MKHIPRFFIKDRIIENEEIIISSDQMYHAEKVLRLKENDIVHLFNGEFGEWKCAIKNVKKNSVLPLELIRKSQIEEGPSLACALINPNKFALMLEKVTELGVQEIFPIITEYTQYKNFNRIKMEQVMIHACEQSRRMTIPVLHEAVSLKNFLNNFDENKKLFVGLEKKTTTAGLVNFGKNCTFLVGPEGGFSEKEVKLFSEYEFISEFYFGRNILRSETACIAFIACCVANCA